MKERRTDRHQQAANYFDEGFRALFKQHFGHSQAEFWEKMNEHKGHAEELCRKQIIQAFDIGFKLGVFWHIETTSSRDKLERDTGTDFYRNIYEGGEHDAA